MTVSSPYGLCCPEGLRVALLEDDFYQREPLRSLLQKAGMQVSCFGTAGDFLRDLRENSFDCFLLDWNLPDISGYEVLIRLRSSLGIDKPVILITGREAEDDVFRGFAAGADDYVVKPVRKLDILARIGAVTRRMPDVRGGTALLQMPPYAFDLRRNSVTLRGRDICLPGKEFDLAVFLFRNIDRIVVRSHLLACVWGLHADVQTRSLDTYMCNLRKRLVLCPENGYRLRSMYGIGYRLERVIMVDAAEDQA